VPALPQAYDTAASSFWLLICSYNGCFCSPMLYKYGAEGVSASDTISDTDTTPIPYPYDFGRIGQINELKRLVIIWISVSIRSRHKLDMAQPKALIVAPSPSVYFVD
jgi:hypothetical protein